MLRAGLSFLLIWLVMVLVDSARMLPSAADFVLGFEPAFLGLGVAFTLYGSAFHLAINIVHWRQAREDDYQAQVALSGRKRFERRKALHVDFMHKRTWRPANK
jgi:hypothetical protein